MSHSLLASFAGADWTGPVIAFFQVVLIDLVLAGDNAVAVGLAASGLDPRQRRRVILSGLGAAVILRIAFALFVVQLMNLIGLLLAGGILLLWVCWKMWRELRARALAGHADAGAPAKTFGQAFFQIFAADVSMSLDNVLAVAGAARKYEYVVVIGLLLSIALMGVAANAIAKFLNRIPWIGYLGVVIVLYVSLHMIWEGYRDTVIDLHDVGVHNAAAPAWLDIKPAEVAKHIQKK